MSITAKTRKILWSKSGNRCAICKKQLVQNMHPIEGNFILGEECHIISSKENGPRGKVKVLKDFDVYENLILLCANDHKLIDEFPDTFTFEVINSVKINHENWIESVIDNDLEAYARSVNNIEILDEIDSRPQLEQVLANVHFVYFDVSSIIDMARCELVSGFFDDLRDFVDIYADISFSNKNIYLNEYMSIIKRLKEDGILIFGKPIERQYSFGQQTKSSYKIALLIALDTRCNTEGLYNGRLSIKLPDNFVPSW